MTPNLYGLWYLNDSPHEPGHTPARVSAGLYQVVVNQWTTTGVNLVNHAGLFGAVMLRPGHVVRPGHVSIRPDLKVQRPTGRSEGVNAGRSPTVGLRDAFCWCMPPVHVAGRFHMTPISMSSKLQPRHKQLFACRVDSVHW